MQKAFPNNLKLHHAAKMDTNWMDNIGTNDQQGCTVRVLIQYIE